MPLKSMQKKMVASLVTILILMVTFGCKGMSNQEKPTTQVGDIKAVKDSLLETDRSFSTLSIGAGVIAAFDSFMADDATMFRNRANPFTGRDAIHTLESQAPSQGTLQWQPYFADAAASGDLGYTLGKWRYTLIDSTGALQASDGYYVTIWKKQPDGKWKFIFDSGVSGPPPAEKK